MASKKPTKPDYQDFEQVDSQDEIEPESGLTFRRLRFVDAYLNEANYNATQAAKMAGYSARTAYSIGSRLLKKVEIQQEIRRRMMPADELQNRLTEYARGSFTDLLDDDGTINLKKAKKSGKARLIKRFRAVFTPGTKQVSYSYELHDPIAAMDKIARIQGLYDKEDSAPLNINVTTEIIMPQLEDEELDEVSGDE